MSKSGALLQWINRRLPWIKCAIPTSIRRLILVHMVGVLDGYVPPVSRRWLETDVLPILPKLGFRKVLFVGAAPYTFHYQEIFTAAGGIWITADVNPSARVWGARKHAIVPIQKIHQCFSKDSFDAVILNGVFGFGVNSVSEMNSSIEAIQEVLRSGGLLLLGWNTDLIADPLFLNAMRGGFRPAVELPIPWHREFIGETHVYEFQIWAPKLLNVPKI